MRNISTSSRVCGFFERSIIFLTGGKLFSLLLCRSYFYITLLSGFLCGYVRRSAGVTSLYMLVYQPTWFKSRFSTRWLWVMFSINLKFSQIFWFSDMIQTRNLTLIYLMLNSVHTGVTTDQIFLEKVSWYALDSVHIFGISWGESLITPGTC